jgi:CYTH domain-containing protein
MPRHLEIERKFLVHSPPPRWQRFASTKIIQGYFPIANKDLEIRLRRKGSQHFVTFKAGHGQSRLEEEMQIPQPKFRALWPLTRAARISKRRYRIPWDGRIIEMDVYYGSHRGLFTADIEFDSVRESRAFRAPEWLDREITGNPQYANRTLAQRRRLPRKQTRA